MTDEDKPKNKGGRPRKFAADTRNPTLSFRVRGGLYEKIKAAAERDGRSLSEEIERRLDSGDFFEFLTDLLDEWSGDDADELLELLDTQLGDVGIDLKFEKRGATADPDEEEAEETTEFEDEEFEEDEDLDEDDEDDEEDKEAEEDEDD